MTIQVDFWQLLTLGVTLIGMVGGALWALTKMIMHQLDARFAMMAQVRQEGRRQLLDRLTAIEHGQREIEREYLELKAYLPREYVRREDFIRETAVVIARLDGLATRIEMVMMRLPRGGEASGP